MSNAALSPVYFSDEELAPLVNAARHIVETYSQIHLSEKQFSMISARLIRRMYELGLNQPSEYLRYIESQQATESTVLISILTTHHTHFFREFEQFEFLSEHRLTSIVNQLRRHGRSKLRIASLACSRGHEVYTIAMFLERHLPVIAPDMTFEIIGMDIDPDSIAIARNGVYPWEEVKSIPTDYATSHWQRGRGSISDFVRVADRLRSRCTFRVGNLLDASTFLELSGEGETFDLIFCRNVFLYFTDRQIQDTANRILKCLSPWGFFLIGVSESLAGRNLPLRSVGHAIYAPNLVTSELKTNSEIISLSTGKGETLEPTKVAAAPTESPALATQPVRILCVDDSATIINLLRVILQEKFGFQVVATAKNGIEAAEKLRTHQVDAMVLDIHMPLKNGIEYLETEFGPSHPPVIILSSVEREDRQVGLRALELGASDYVEKPTMSDLQTKGEELRVKIKSAITSRSKNLESKKDRTDLTRSFAHSSGIKNPDTKLRIIFCTARDQTKCSAMLQTLTTSHPPTVILVEGTDSNATRMMNAVTSSTKQLILPIPEQNRVFLPGSVYVGSLQSHVKAALSLSYARRTVVFISASVDSQAFAEAAKFQGSRIFLEESSDGSDPEQRTRDPRISRCIPYSSFFYESELYLKRD
jgi:chemotaxis protein methyltransferase CheR